MLYELGTVGMVCPFPLIEAQKKMQTLDNGDELKIDFDCTQATEAILIGQPSKVIQLRIMNN